MQEKKENSRPQKSKLLNRAHLVMEKTETELEEAIRMTDNKELREKLKRIARDVNDMQM